MAKNPGFETTKWSVVLAASRAPEEGGSRDALERLCEAYWHPVFAFVRRSGRGEDDALDETQEFFSGLIESGVLAAADPDRGRFRSFLLSMVKQHLSHSRDRAGALKRGGAVTFVSLETARQLEPTDDPSDSPERAFERQWALNALDRTKRALAGELAAAGKETQYRVLGDYLSGGNERPYSEAARELGTSEPAVKMAVHRLRHRFGHLLREEIAQTVATEADVDSEVRFLLRAL